MTINLTTENPISAMILKERILKSVKGEVDGLIIDTWSYKKSGDNYDIIYHNPTQYADNPEKNVLFRVEVDGSIVTLSTAWWKKNPEPSDEMLCIHTGRLTEMLLCYFRACFIKFSIVD